MLFTCWKQQSELLRVVPPAANWVRGLAMRIANIPVVFQYCLPKINSNIPLTVSLILFSFFQFLYWLAFYFTHIMYTNCQIPDFYLACFPASHFETFIVPFLCLLISVSSLIGQNSRHIIFQYSSLYHSCTRSIFHLPSFYFSVLRFNSRFPPFAWGSAHLRHLRDGT